MANPGFSFGNVKLCKIINESQKNVSFKNPNKKREGCIAPGKTDDDDCAGYLPGVMNKPRYEITYYNEVLNKECLVEIKDLVDAYGKGLISFAHDGKTEHITEMRPQAGQSDAHFQVTVKHHGIEIYNIDTQITKSALFYW